MPEIQALVVESWFDGESHRKDSTTFLIVDGKVTSIEQGDVANQLGIQGIKIIRRAFLMPSLVDAHVHLFLDGRPTDTALRSAHLKMPIGRLTDAARGSARQAHRCGVTLVRDAGDRHGINNQIREEARSRDSELCRVRSGGLGVKRPKRYGAFMARDVEDDDAIRASVTELAAINDEIKLILTGIIDFEAGAVTDEPQFDVEAVRLVVETARLCGRRTFAHCSGIKGLDIAIEAGVGSIEHGFFITRDHLAAMADKGIAWTPTFCPVHFQWARPEIVGWSPQTIGNLRRILDSHSRSLQIADELGVTLLLGTDAGSMGVEHGHAVYEEVGRYLEAGLSMEATLRAATSTPRRYFGESVPVIKVGSLIEGLLFDHSPFTDHTVLKSPRSYLRGSEIVTLGSPN